MGWGKERKHLRASFYDTRKKHGFYGLLAARFGAREWAEQMRRVVCMLAR